MVPKGEFSGTSAPFPLLVLSRPSAITKSPASPPSSYYQCEFVKFFQCFMIVTVVFMLKLFQIRFVRVLPRWLLCPLDMSLSFFFEHFLAQDVPVSLRNHGMKENFSGREE